MTTTPTKKPMHLKRQLYISPDRAIIFLSVLFLVTSCGPDCDEKARKEAWKKYDTAVLTATQEKGKKPIGEFSAAYANVVDASISKRKAELTACHCPQDRPAMSDADIKADRAALRRLETKFLVSVCTEYSASHRAVDSDGAPKYRVDIGDEAYIFHPMYLVLSQEAFDSLRISTTIPIDTSLSDTAQQSMVIKVYKNMPVKDVIERFGPFALDEQYRAFYNYSGPDFLSAIEQFHNNKDNWSRCGLSNTGRNNVLTICKQHELNSSDVMDALTAARVFCD